MSTRRNFLQGCSAIGLIACTSSKEADSGLDPIGIRPDEPVPWEPAGTLDTMAFPSGIQVGDVQGGHAVVSVQTTLDKVEWVLVQQSETEWTEIQRGPVESVDGTVQFRLSELESDSAFSIVCYDTNGENRSTTTRFRSGLGDDDWRIVTFGATSCLGGNRPWSSLTKAATEQFDFFLMLGDTVYTNARNPNTAWADWKSALRVQGFQDLSQSTSVIATWDDHELVNNFDWNLIEDPQTVYDNAWALMQKALPLDTEQTGKLYRKVSHGQVCDVFVLDCRGERRSAEGLYISTEQMLWLKTELSASTARFKFIMNSVPITDFNDLIGEIEAIDRWQGFPEQRLEILSHIEDNGIAGVLWLSGDFHFGLFAQVSPVGQVGDSMMEILNGPTGSFINPMGELLVPTEQFQQAVGTWSYSRYECNPQTGEVLVQFIGDDGVVLMERVIAL